MVSAQRATPNTEMMTCRHRVRHWTSAGVFCASAGGSKTDEAPSRWRSSEKTSGLRYRRNGRPPYYVQFDGSPGAVLVAVDPAHRALAHVLLCPAATPSLPAQKRRT